MANQLVSADPEVSYFQNNIGKSPLYLAVESGNKDIIEYILEALPQTDCLIDKLEAGRSPVHIAITKKNLGMSSPHLMLVYLSSLFFFILCDFMCDTLVRVCCLMAKLHKFTNIQSE